MRFVTINGRRVNTAAVVEIREGMNPRYQIDLAFYMYQSPMSYERSEDGSIMSSYKSDPAPRLSDYPDGVCVTLSNGEDIFMEGKTKKEVEEIINERR